MTGLRPHTKSYSQEARETLGLAIQRAREAAGYPSRPAFAKASGVGKTSLYKLEIGTPVSALVYEAAARAIPLWTEDTPVRVLNGEQPPSTEAVAAAARADTSPVDTSATEIPTGWSGEEEQRWIVARETLAALKLKTDLTRRQFRIMRDEFDQLEAMARARQGHVTPSDRS